MAVPKRIVITVTLSFFVILLLLTRSGKETWRDHAQRVAQVAGMGESASEYLRPHPKQSPASHDSSNPTDRQEPAATFTESEPKDWKAFLVGGTPKPPGSNYTRMLVVPKTEKEDLAWMDEHIPDIQKSIYHVDDPDAKLHPPANKGHEAMVYLTYIIDHYDELADVTLFMHAHQRTWHNNDVFNADAGEMVRRLSSERVMREGYMNLRCQWHPGCPDWMHPGNTDFDVNKSEQHLIAKAWVELFPFDPVPDVLAQPCCSQYALSRERIQSIPKKQFEFYRNWIMNTKLNDFLSGRVWEYMWQYAYTGKNYVCPAEHVCYCDGYGACFGGEAQYAEWNLLKNERDKYNMKLLRWQQQEEKIKKLREEGKNEEADKEEVPEPGKDREWWEQIQHYQDEMDEKSEEAIERGRDPRQRAKEAGRPYQEGDGY